MNRFKTSLKVVVASILGATMIQVLSFACSTESGSDSTTSSSIWSAPDANAQEPCAQWEVRTSPITLGSDVTMQPPPGYEPFAFGGCGAGACIFSRRCLSP